MSSGLEQALRFLREHVAPRAQEIDQDRDALAAALAKMGELGLTALKCPAKYGGKDITEAEFRTFQEECARASGTFAFLQTQHQSAAGLINSGTNEALKDDYLPQMAAGKKGVGIGFSQLRRSGPPLVTATPSEGGYIINGHVPWATGHSFFQEFVLGSTLPSGEALFCIMPFSTCPGVKVSPPMELMAMGTAQTVTLDIESYFVPESRVAFIRQAGWIHSSDMVNVALGGHFAIGCSLAGLDILAATAKKKPIAGIQLAERQLREELESCRVATAAAQLLQGEGHVEEKLRVRTWALDLAFRCAQAAVVANSGAANSMAHPAQRIYREALVYAVQAQTAPIMEATLARLVRCGPDPVGQD